MSFYKFTTIVLAVYLVYYLVNILIDLARQKTVTVGTTTLNTAVKIPNPDQFQEKPVEVKSTGIVQEQAPVAEMQNRMPPEPLTKEDKSVLEAIGLEIYADEGFRVDDANLLTVSKKKAGI
jgi:hypothetical protein